MKKCIYLATLLVFGFVAQAQVPQLEDLDGDGFYDMEEFSKIYSKGYNDWDIDRSGQLDRDEFFDATYNRLDLDGNGKLSAQEWRSADPQMEGLIPDEPNNPPSRAIFREQIGKSNYYGNYDLNGDGFVDSEELNQSSFNRLDLNRDGRLDSKELQGY